jgi:uncharacterized protein DUF4314
MDDIDHDALSPSLSWLQGRRIRLVRCDDPHTRLKPGTRGIVTFVDGLDTVHVAWDDGSRLGLIPGVDQWELDTAAPSDYGDRGSGIWSGDHQP